MPRDAVVRAGAPNQRQLGLASSLGRVQGYMHSRMIGPLTPYMDKDRMPVCAEAGHHRCAHR